MSPRTTLSFTAAAKLLAAAAARFYDRGWLLGTSGNLSAVVSRRPLRIAITESSVPKGHLTAKQFLYVGTDGQVAVGRRGRPSAETELHLEIVRRRGAGAVLHTHSVWSTILSERHAADEGLAVEGYEMLKGLDGVRTHAHREWIPIVPNDQDMGVLAARICGALEAHPLAHAVLLQGHGLYTWGATIADAERHVEILEFLLEVAGRQGARPL